jgi:3-phenylpropionate/cinnamic acid dioxygenase small subunit
VDHFEYDAVLGLFTDDVVIDQPGRIIQGRGDFAQVLAVRPRTRSTRHLISNCLVREIREAEFECHSYVTLLAREVDQTQFTVAVVADWHDRVIRTPAGWRISHRGVQPILLK